MAVLASDNFDRANENPLGNGVWTTASGESAMQIVGNVATPSNLAANCGSYYSGISWPADQFSRAKLTCVGTADGGPGLKVRQAAAANTQYRLQASHAATLNIGLAKFVAGTPTDVAGWPRTQAWTDGDTFELRVIGTTLQVFLNGVQVGADATDSSIASGSAGISYSATETSASVNDWEGGDIQTLAPLLGNLFVGRPMVA